MNPVDDFLMTKEAFLGLGGLWKGLRQGASGLGERAGFGLAEAIPSAVVSATIAGTSIAVAKGWGAAKETRNKTRDYEEMLKATPALHKMDAGQVQLTYNSLRATAPSLAGDPLVAGSFVRKTIESSPESGAYVDPLTVKTLAEAQRNISSSRATPPSSFAAVPSMMRSPEAWMGGVRPSHGVKEYKRLSDDK